MNVPAKFIVSHRSPFWLRAIEDQLILKIPNARVPSIQKIFAAQDDFEDVSASLPRRYAGFRSGQEQFFPRRCPVQFKAGRFLGRDRTRNGYICRFLFDYDDANFTTLYLSSISPID